MSSNSVQLAQIFGSGIQPPSEAYSVGSETGTGALTNMETMISNVLGIATVIATIIFIVYFVLAAITWITSGGDTNKVQKARDQIIQGVLGLVILVLMYSLVGLIGTIFGLQILRPGQTLERLIPLAP